MSCLMVTSWRVTVSFNSSSSLRRILITPVICLVSFKSVSKYLGTFPICWMMELSLSISGVIFSFTKSGTGHCSVYVCMLGGGQQATDSQSSDSSNQNLKFFTIFSKQRNGENNLSSKAKVSIQSKGKSRMPGRISKSNPTHPLITRHFKPASKKSEASNEPGDENGGGQEIGISSAYSVDSVVTRPRPIW